MGWKSVEWEGDSKDVINDFSEEARENLGNDLGRVQGGLRPLDSKPMRIVGKGVFELRDADNDFWYRVFYVEIEEMIYVLHCFKKKSDKPSPNDVMTGQQRYKALQERLKQQKRLKKK